MGRGPNKAVGICMNLLQDVASILPDFGCAVILPRVKLAFIAWKALPLEIAM
jgi:hypothetical protein